MIPKSSVVNDYPKAIQLRSMIEKMKDDFDETEVVYHIEKVIGTGDQHTLFLLYSHIVLFVHTMENKKEIAKKNKKESNDGNMQQCGVLVQI